MIGGADLLMWKNRDRTRYLLRLDPVRAAIVRIYLMARGDTGGTILINAPTEPPIDAAELAQIEQLAARLPPGDGFVVQRKSSRDAFPPIARPVVSSVQATESEIVIVSRAQVGRAESPSHINARFPQGALLSATFRSPPRVLDDLNRLFGTKVSHLFSDGGSVALYDVDTGTLLPRPLGVMIFPPTEERRATVQPLTKYGLRVAERPDELVVSFDRSLDTYLKDRSETVALAAGRWAARIDAQRLTPILHRLNDNLGLRIASPRLFRGARDLGRWIGSLEQAKIVEATDSIDGPDEELKVRVSAK